MIRRSLSLLLLAALLPACSNKSLSRFAAAKRANAINAAQVTRAQNQAALARVWNPTGAPPTLLQRALGK